MRPQLFRMASELQPNEEGMTEILQANDTLIRVLDYYKRIFNPDGEATEQSTDMPTTINQTAPTPISNETKPASPTGAQMLLDLTDLNFGTPTLPVTNGTSGGAGNITTATDLLSELNLLDIPSPSLVSFNSIIIPISYIIIF